MRAFNFSAGPSTLPTEVLEKVQSELLDYDGTGMSVIEMSHRWDFFENIYKESVESLRRIAGIPDRFDIFYMTGGASTQFALVPMNLSGPGKKAGYVNTGVWSKKAIEQAKIQGLDYKVVGSSEETAFDRIPAINGSVEDLDYVHITSNNTIYGTQYRTLPSTGKLVIDMSSDFLSAPLDWDGIYMVYAGMQKNAGVAGATAVIIDKELYAREKETTPTIFRYSTMAASDSMYNTPPTFQIYVFNLILKWIEKQGGLVGIRKRNENKAAILYNYLDSHPDFFKGHALIEDRSLMNVTFNLLQGAELEAKMVAEANERKLWGLKGHRLIGGLRASIYNAMSNEGCEALVEFFEDFRMRNK